MPQRRCVRPGAWLLSFIALGILLAVAASRAPDAEAAGDHLMCGWRAEPRTQRVAIEPGLAAAGVTRDDVLAAFEPWNRLFERYHGFSIFAIYDGDAEKADVIVAARGTTPWVDTVCRPGYVAHGSVKAVVWLGSGDAPRNGQLLAHELGHALGFSDHGSAGDQVDGHIGFKPCTGYIGVMSYCTSVQSWFLDQSMPGFVVDGDLVRQYWESG